MEKIWLAYQDIWNEESKKRFQEDEFEELPFPDRREIRMDYPKAVYISYLKKERIFIENLKKSKNN